MAKKVSIEVGHGGKDPGAVYNGFRESDINLAVGLELKRQLERHGVVVLISRFADIDDTAASFIPRIKLFAPDAGVSVHFNASVSHIGDGAELYYNPNAGSEGLCRCIEREIKNIGQNSRGLKPKPDNNLGIMSAAPVYAYIEGGFLDNKTDLQSFDTLAEQKEFAVAYAKGILSYFGIAWKMETIPDVPKKLYRIQVGAFSSRENAEKFLNGAVRTAGLDGFIIES